MSSALPTLKSGVDITGGITSLQKALFASLFTVFTDKAMGAATLFALHDGRLKVSGEDVVLGLQYQVLSPNGCAVTLKQHIQEVTEKEFIEDLDKKPDAMKAVTQHMGAATQAVLQLNKNESETRQLARFITEQIIGKTEESEEEDFKEHDEDENEDEDEDEDENEDEDEDEDEDENEDDLGPCECTFCCEMRMMPNLWEVWQPQDVWEHQIHDAIQKARLSQNME